MNDTTKPRDLVALAAKAAGYKSPIVYDKEDGAPYARVSKRDYFCPFDVPGDALMLSCTLSMTLDYTEDNNGTYVVTRARANGKHYCCVQPYRAETKLAMTMYAITYVAASIGEEMEDVPA